MRKRKKNKLAQKGMKTKAMRKTTTDQEKGTQAEKMSQKNEKPTQVGRIHRNLRIKENQLKDQPIQKIK